MGRACCVLGCPSGGDAPSHQIPKNPILFQKWKTMIYSEKIQHLTDEQISKCTVCYRHFADDDYLVTFRIRKLKRGVMPSLNLPNKPVSNALNLSQTKSQTANTNIFIEETKKEIKGNKTENQTIMEVSNQITLFEDAPDAPEEAEFCLFNQSLQTSLNEHTEEINSMTETFKLHHRKKISRRVRLIAEQSSLLRHKKQAMQYEKTPTIQKLLSFLTPIEIMSIKNRIQKSRYSPKVYVKVYHDIAKRKALGQL
ncbi:hypothetical protein P5V15_012450 [Pogonomyrmex californicus]